MTGNRLFFILFAGISFYLLSGESLHGQTTGPGSPGLRIDVSGSNEEGDFGVAIQLVVAMTILTLGPSVLMMMTCFTRIVIVLGFVRNAVGVNAAPSSQIIVGLALFLTFFLMGPVWNKIYDNAITPYMVIEFGPPSPKPIIVNMIVLFAPLLISYYGVIPKNFGD